MRHNLGHSNLHGLADFQLRDRIWVPAHLQMYSICRNILITPSTWSSITSLRPEFNIFFQKLGGLIILI